MKASNLRPLSNFAEFETEVPLAQELPYWEFMDDTVILADGTLVKDLKIKGVSIETWDSERINQFTLGLRSFLNSLPDGVEISFVSETNSNLESVISAHESLGGEQAQIKWLNTERVKNFRLEASDNSLLKPNLHLFLYRRLEGNEKSSGLNFIKAFFQSAKAIQNINKEAHEKAMRELTLLVDSTKERLDANGIESVFIGVDEIRQMIFGFLNPSKFFNENAPKENVHYLEQEFSTEEQSKVKALSYPSPRDQLVGSSLVQTYDSFYLDKKYHRIITLKTLPEFTHSALMTKLLNLDFPNLIHVHIKVPEQSKELSSLQAKRRMAHSM